MPVKRLRGRPGEGPALSQGKLGFVKKLDIPMGEHKWLTVVSPEDPGGPQVLLEPVAFAPAKTYQQERYKAGIPLVAFEVKDVHAEYERLAAAGVQFKMQPTKAQGAVITQRDDTCSNYVQLLQVAP